MEIHQIPILQDNYCHVLVTPSEGVLAVVDPAEPEKVIPLLREFELPLKYILCTHHHWDHAGGNEEMLQAFPEATVVCSHDDAPKIAGAEKIVGRGDELLFGSRKFSVLEVPCHTRGHVAFLIDGNLFCGDTLFVAGCGRFFEGEAAEMDEALNGVFGALPPETQVFCGHEYTVGNLLFAQNVEPDNPDVAAKLAWAKETVGAGDSTVPSTLGEERSYNPFMRVRNPEMLARLGVDDSVSAMALLRERKNNFKG